MTDGPLQIGKTEQTTIPANVHKYGAVDIFELSRAEINELRGSNFWKTLASVMFGVGASAAISIWVTLETVKIDDPIKHASFVAVLIISLLVALIFCIIWIRQEIGSTQLAKRLEK